MNVARGYPTFSWPTGIKLRIMRLFELFESNCEGHALVAAKAKRRNLRRSRHWCRKLDL
jgi:hypothetical protein